VLLYTTVVVHRVATGDIYNESLGSVVSIRERAAVEATITGLAGTTETALYNVMAGVKLEDNHVAWIGSDSLGVEGKAIFSNLNCMYGGQGSCHHEWEDRTTHYG